MLIAKERCWIGVGILPWSILSCTENIADALNYIQRDAAEYTAHRAVPLEDTRRRDGGRLQEIYRVRFRQL